MIFVLNKVFFGPELGLAVLRNDLNSTKCIQLWPQSDLSAVSLLREREKQEEQVERTLQDEMAPVQSFSHLLTENALASLSLMIVLSPALISDHSSAF